MDTIARDAIESLKSPVKPSYALSNLLTLYLYNEDEETGIISPGTSTIPRAAITQEGGGIPNGSRL